MNIRLLQILVITAIAATVCAQTVPIISTFAGTGTPGTAGDGGLATMADIYPYGGLSVDRWGNVFFSDIGFDDGEIRIRRVDAVTNIVTTVAGGGAIAYPNDGIAATQASISFAYAIAIDDDGNLFFGDSEGIRRVDAFTGLLSTYAGGNPPTVFQPYIHPITGTNLNPLGIPTTVNGSPGVWLSSGDGGLATDAVVGNAWAMTFAPDGDLVFMELWQVRRIDGDTGIITSVAGNPMTKFHYGTIYNANPSDAIFSGFYSGDGGLAVNSGISQSFTLALNTAGDLFFGDNDVFYNDPPLNKNHIRRIDAATGIIAPYAGTGIDGFSGDGGPALLAEIS